MVGFFAPTLIPPLHAANGLGGDDEPGWGDLVGSFSASHDPAIVASIHEYLYVRTASTLYLPVQSQGTRRQDIIPSTLRCQWMDSPSTSYHSLPHQRSTLQLMFPLLLHGGRSERPRARSHFCLLHCSFPCENRQRFLSNMHDLAAA